jgi:hypothetical protein
MISTFPMTAEDFLLHIEAGLTLWEQNEDRELVWFGTREQRERYEQLTKEAEEIIFEF